MKASTLITLVAALAPGVLSKGHSLPLAFVPPLNTKAKIPSEAEHKFKDALVPTVAMENTPNERRQISNGLEGGAVFVLQCVDRLFISPCASFQSSPGVCVTYSDFDPDNTTLISDYFKNRVSSISTNTGGSCQFYDRLGCDYDGRDRGVTINYNNDLSVNTTSYGGNYDNAIESWRC